MSVRTTREQIVTLRLEAAGLFARLGVALGEAAIEVAAGDSLDMARASKKLHDANYLLGHVQVAHIRLAAIIIQDERERDAALGIKGASHG